MSAPEAISPLLLARHREQVEWLNRETARAINRLLREQYGENAPTVTFESPTLEGAELLNTLALLGQSGDPRP